MRTADQRHEDSLRDMGVFMPKYRARRGNYGLWSTLFPHIIGFIAGLAITKLFGMSGAAYVVFGTICAFAAGTYKKHYDGQNIVSPCTYQKFTDNGSGCNNKHHCCADG